MGRKLDTNSGGKTVADGTLVKLALADLQPFSRHPYKVRDDEAMRDMVESVKQYGVLSPAIARPLPDGGYELVSGHRRKRACELAELETMPVIVRELDDDAAAILVVDSNLQREDLLPSERAFAYKLKLEAIRHQGERTDLTSAQVGPKLTAAEKVAEESPDSKSQIKRYIRLTELIPPLLDMVDERRIAFNPAYELSFLTKDEQRLLLAQRRHHRAALLDREHTAEAPVRIRHEPTVAAVEHTAADEQPHEPVFRHAELFRRDADGNGVAGVYESVKVVRFRQKPVHALRLLVERINDGVGEIRVARELLEQWVGYVETVLAYRGQDFGGYPALEALSRSQTAGKHEGVKAGFIRHCACAGYVLDILNRS